MGKVFQEVFPTLQLNNELTLLLDDVMVERITATKRRDFLRIFLAATHLITKEKILQLEHELKKQLFPTVDMVIKIYEKYRLSAQYTPEKLFEVY